MDILYNFRIVANARKFPAVLLFLLLSAITLQVLKNKNFNDPRRNSRYSMILLSPEGYDAKTGKWINKKPSTVAFAISPETYQKVKNWYATDSGGNNPEHLEVEAPKEGFTYIYTPYNDPKHPNSVGMSAMGLEGYKGYWYADDLSKATDSMNDAGEDVPIPPPVRHGPDTLAFGGYDARTGNWINTSPSEDAFPVSSVQYNHVKNWFATGFGANNPLNLSLQIPREGFTYLYVPFNDPKHPGIMGMSFQGGNALRGYWYADRIGATKDTISTNSNNSNTTPVQQQSIQQANPPAKQDN